MTNKNEKAFAVMQELSKYNEKGIEYLFTDVDDTITLNGKLIPQALEALWLLKENNIKTICVTGGSAGWADIYLRQWPIEAVVTESGALGFYKRDGRYCRWTHPSIDISTYEQKKIKLIETVKKNCPFAKLSSDQFSRIYDVAFDHGSEKPFLKEKEIQKIVNICRDFGAQVAVSSIHINAWFGSYDKREGTLAFMKDIFDKDFLDLKNKSVYCGDAPNDQSMFEIFPLSFAPVNIYKKEDELIYKPSFVSREEGGKGFAQIVNAIIKKNQKN